MQVESLRAQVAQKDMFISELLDRIAIVECEVRPVFGWGHYFVQFLVCGGYLCMATDHCLGCYALSTLCVTVCVTFTGDASGGKPFACIWVDCLCPVFLFLE